MSDLPVIDPREGTDDDTDREQHRVAGILLASGTSARFGEANKLLVEIDGGPLVRCAARTLVDAGVDPVLVVVGHEAERVKNALDGLPVAFVENPAYETGRSSSIRAGIHALPDDVDAVVIALGDMPFVDPGTVDLLVDADTRDTGSVLAAAYESQRGNPVLFDARHFDALRDLEGETGGRDILLETEDAALVETGDPGVRRDVDRPDDVDA